MNVNNDARPIKFVAPKLVSIHRIVRHRNGGAYGVAIVAVGGEYTLANYDPERDQWACTSRVNGYGVGNTAVAAVRGSWGNGGGGPITMTHDEARADVDETVALFTNAA